MCPSLATRYAFGSADDLDGLTAAYVAIDSESLANALRVNMVLLHISTLP